MYRNNLRFYTRNFDEIVFFILQKNYMKYDERIIDQKCTESSL